MRESLAAVAVLALCTVLVWNRWPNIPSPAEAATSTCEEILVPMPDGTRLHGWARHGATAPATRPIVWTMTPYTNTECANGGPFGSLTAAMVEKVTIVRISYRGTGASEGEQDAWGPGDRQDIIEVGNWLATRP